MISALGDIAWRHQLTPSWLFYSIFAWYRQSFFIVLFHVFGSYSCHVLSLKFIFNFIYLFIKNTRYIQMPNIEISPLGPLKTKGQTKLNWMHSLTHCNNLQIIIKQNLCTILRKYCFRSACTCVHWVYLE